MKKLVSIDIGSTYTKGILLQLDQGRASILQKKNVPTSIADLGQGFFEVYHTLVEEKSENSEIEVYFSSSAKGGLSIAAIGIVP
ncbi:MAG: glutamate mutase L, partial [Spirochaetes bacterium]|nr:glutamate mutase L [Spirochaetota bacterium]